MKLRVFEDGFSAKAFALFLAIVAIVVFSVGFICGSAIEIEEAHYIASNQLDTESVDNFLCLRCHGLYLEEDANKDMYNAS